MAELIRVRREPSYAVVTIDRPERHNSLTPELLDQLRNALTILDNDKDVRCVVLAAAGRTFSTGGDVAGFRDAPDIEVYADRTVGLLNRVMMTMIDLTHPIVVAVHGMVTGGSIGLVLASDVVLVGPGASFTPWYREVGFSPDGGWTAILPEVIGHHRAADVLMTNRTISAAEAMAWGLASRLVDGDVLARAEDSARLIAEGVAGSIRHTKRLLRSERDRVAAALNAERRRFVEQISTVEVEAGMAHFLQK